MMKVKQFVRDSPLGLGWVLGHVSLKQAVAALAKATQTTDQAVMTKYRLTDTSKEEDR